MPKQAEDHKQNRKVPAAQVVVVTAILVAMPWPLMCLFSFIAVCWLMVPELRNLDARTWERLTRHSRSSNLEWLMLVLFVPALTWIDYRQGRAVLTLVILCIYIGDVAALYGGERFGRRKLARQISSGKTIEGVICALIAAWLVSWAVWAVTGLQISLLDLSATVGVLTLIGVIGDLNESWLKRQAGVKDSGTRLGPMGGILDRCDSLMAASFGAVALVSFHWL